MLKDQPWEFPKLNIGDTIIWATNPDDLKPDSNGLMPRACSATAVNVYERTVDAQCNHTRGGQTFRWALHHADDPLLLENPDWLKEKQSGVFRVAACTQLPKDNAAAIARLEDLIEAGKLHSNKLAKKIDSLKKTAGTE